MKILRRFKSSLAALGLASSLLSAMALQADTESVPKSSVQKSTVQKGFEQIKPLRIALVSFKTCVEKSKLGQKEQNAFEAMKKQMETILLEKEKGVMEVASKFNDIDYLDSLSPDAEAELKRQYRTLSQEFQQQQNQFYQTLSQANVMIVQKLTQEVTKASESVAKANKIDMLVTDDSVFYSTASIDVSDMIIRVMDENFAKEGADSKTTASPANTKN